MTTTTPTTVDDRQRLRELRARAERHALRNDADGYDAFWSDDAIVGLYLEPARVENFRLVAELCADWPGEVIDLGCGSGTMLAEVLAADRTGGRKRVTGVDYAPSAVERCRRLLPGGSFLRRDLCDTGLAGGAYDVVLSMQTLEHVAEPRRAFDEMWRLCRPGGRIVVTIPDGAVDAYEGHCNFWTIDAFPAMAGRAASVARRFNGGRNLLFVFER